MIKKMPPGFLSIIWLSLVTKQNHQSPLACENQMKWQAMEYYAFIHFSLTTYTDPSWGYGEFPLLERRKDLNMQPWGSGL